MSSVTEFPKKTHTLPQNHTQPGGLYTTQPNVLHEHHQPANLLHLHDSALSPQRQAKVVHCLGWLVYGIVRDAIMLPLGGL